MLTFLIFAWGVAGFSGFWMLKNWYQYKGQWDLSKLSLLLPTILFGPVTLMYSINFIAKRCHCNSK